MVDISTTVAETNAFIAQAKGVFSDRERLDVISMIAADPKCGAVMKGTGGVRKVRAPLSGRGKSGGARVVYFITMTTSPFISSRYSPKTKKTTCRKPRGTPLKKPLRPL